MSERDIFIAALEIEDPAERAAYLDRACAGDAGLLQRVEGLLGAHSRAGQFLDKPAVEQLAAQGGLSEDPTQLGSRLVGEAERTPDAPSESTQAEPPHDEDDLSLDFLSPSQRADSLGRLGHYEVLELVGRGGMGVVLRAFDETLHRVVAIKVMAPQLATSATARRRFLREARAVAAVSHDNVVTIHAVEEGEGVPYLVMQFVAGMSLQDKLDRQGPAELKEIVRIGMQAAAGLAAAHAHGITHRDVKPANILLENGVERVKITDFGLARALDDASLTQSGLIAGTPQYMSPEQAEGRPAGHRSDLFSLGSVLYALCTGRPPFRADTTTAVLRRVCEDVPRPIREVNPDVPGWLCDIIGRLHAKNPADRFQTAAEVASLLGEHLARLQRPDASQPEAEAEKASKPRDKGKADAKAHVPARRRRRWQVAAAALLLLLTGLGLTEATGITRLTSTVIRVFTPQGTLVVEVDDPNVKVTIDGDDLVIHGAGVQEVRLRPGTYQLRATKDGEPVKLSTELVTITQGGKQVVRISREAAPTARAVEVVQPEPLPDLSPGSPLSPFALVTRPAALKGVRSWSIETSYSRAEILGIAYSPDGRLLATASDDGTIRLWEPKTGRHVRVLLGNEAGVWGVTWSPDGKYLASCSHHDSTVRLWQADTGRLLRTFLGRSFHKVAWSPDGKTVAAGGNEDKIRLWNPASGELRLTLTVSAGGTHSIVWSPDSKTLAAAGDDKVVRLWDATTGELLHAMLGHTERVYTVAWSPDGKTLASCSEDGTVRLWDAQTGLTLWTGAEHANGWVSGLAWSPDGKQLVSSGMDQTLRFWNPGTGKALRAHGIGREITLIAWAPDGKTLSLSNRRSPVVHLVDADSCKLLRDLGRGTVDSSLRQVAWSPDGLSLSTTGAFLQIWEARSGRCSLTVPTNHTTSSQVWSPDGKSVIAQQIISPGTLHQWNAASGARVRTFEASPPGMPELSLVWSPDGKTLAGGGYTKGIHLWDGPSGKLSHTLTTEGFELPLTGLSWSPDGKLLASGHPWQDTVRIWQPETGKCVQTFKGVGGSSLAWSRDGKSLAVGGGEGSREARLIDPASGRVLKTFEGHWKLGEVFWMPDGRTLLTVDLEKKPRVWDALGGRLLSTFAGPGGRRYQGGSSLSPDGRFLAAIIPSSVRIWETAGGQPTGALLPLADGQTVALSADGHFRCSPGTAAQLVYVVETDEGQETLRPDQFEQKYGWKNDPERVRLNAAVTRPFVILACAGKAERAFATLAEAVLRASDGDTIEVCGDGPFITEPIKITRKALTIRAGDGFRPHLRLRPEVIDQVVLTTTAALVLEGLTVEAAGKRQEQFQGGVIFSYDAPLHISHCRLLGPDGSWAAVRTHRVAACSIQNCILGRVSVGIGFDHLPRKARYVLDNNVILGGSLAMQQTTPDVEDVSVRLRNNTFLSAVPIHFGFNPPLSKILDERPNPKVPGLRLEASGNILDSGWAVFFVSPYEKSLALEKTVPLLPRLVSFQDDGNLYSNTPETFLTVNRYEEPKPLKAFKTLAEWHKFWGVDKSSSQIGDAQFQSGDLRAKASASPGQLIPDDFRLAKGSPGQGAGPGGKDLGADVDLVGPGAAYERWKRTPAYQQWLKVTGQTAANPPQDRPFVTLAAGGKDERPFRTLAEAVADADDEGTIEIRGDGPFITDPVVIVGKALTLRAASGFCPVLRLSPEGAKVGAKLLETKSPLTLEGLELQRVGHRPWRAGDPIGVIVSSHQAPLFAANCRFLVKSSLNAVTSYGGRAVEFRNCEFISPENGGVDWNAAEGRLVMDNCVQIIAGGHGLHYGPPPLFKDVSVRLTRNTLVGEKSWVFFLGKSEVDPKLKPIRLEAEGNIFDATSEVFDVVDFRAKDDPQRAARAEGLIPRLLTWRGEHNLLPTAPNLARFPGPAQPATMIRTLAEWKKFWGSPETGSLQGRVRYRKGDLRTRAASQPEQIGPEDFRLHPDSPGKSAGEGGRDLGADVDLVGPGAAYERWKKTPEYRQWMESVSRMLRDKP